MLFNSLKQTHVEKGRENNNISFITSRIFGALRLLPNAVIVTKRSKGNIAIFYNRGQLPKTGKQMSWRISMRIVQ